MGWQRKIPFGYQMRCATIQVNEAETAMVRKIYAMYLSGNSLNTIAAEAESSGIPYHAGSKAWNKNMVKRILDNSRYIGDSDYPMVIDPEDYMRVRLVNQKKNDRRKPCEEAVQSLSRIMMCSLCGSRMHRHTKRGRPRWVCANENCHETVVVADSDLRTEIDRCLDRLALSPTLLEQYAPDKQQANPDVLRLQNELTTALNRGTETPEYMRSLVFALAAEQYNALPDMNLVHALKELQDRISVEGITEENRREIEQKAIRRILLGRESGVSIELINGKTISSKEEVE